MIRSNTCFPYRVQRNTFFILLLKGFALAPYGYMQRIAECINAAHTYTMQSAGHLVAVLVELTTGMQQGHYHLQRRHTLFSVNARRYTTAIIKYAYRIVFVYGNGNVFTIARECLINRVIYDLIYQVVQALYTYIAYVHGWALTHRFKTF